MSFFPIAVHMRKFVYSAKLQSIQIETFSFPCYGCGREVRPQGVGLFHRVMDGQQILQRAGETEEAPSSILKG